jgi:hypothetical protein
MTLELERRLERRHDHSLIEHVIEEEAIDDVRLGGNLPLWMGVLVVGLSLLAIGVYNAPATHGFLITIVGGLLLGVAYAEIITRLPTLTHRWLTSFVVLVIATAIIVGIIVMNASAAPVPPQNPDALLTPYH